MSTNRINSHAEILHPGQPSSKMTALLTQAGAQVTNNQLFKAVQEVEASRAHFTTRAVQTGLLLLAKKQTLKHGEFQKLAATLWNMDQSGHHDIHDTEALHNFTRSLRHYTKLAQHFIADLEQNSFQPETGSQRKVISPSCMPEEIVAVVQGTAQNEQINFVQRQIHSFVAGRSLRRMLIDFRKAENAADQEEIDEAAEEEKRKKKKALKEEAHGQTDFLKDLMAPISTIDTYMQDLTFRQHTNKQFWTSLADKLESQATKARSLAKEIAE